MAWPAPTDDRTASCADLTERRVCWGEADTTDARMSADIWVAERPVPSRPTSPLGWRCTGAGRYRSCIERQHGVGPFVCRGEPCVQLHPRFPDDGEWTCSDIGGAVVCTGGDPPAGVPENIIEAGWICGHRHRETQSAGTGERVCVDFAPDFPKGSARGWRCRYAVEQRVSRVCEREARSFAIGDACDGAHPCLDGLRCVDRTCVPERPDPSCAFDADCPQGVCRFGTCRKEST